MKQFHEDLINQALEAAKAGDRNSAYELVKDIVEEDPSNIRAWLLLARFSKDPQERLMAVTSVLNLDPNNQQALKMKAAAEAALEKARTDDIIPGVSRRQLRMIGGIGGAVIVAAAIIIVMVVLNNQSEQEAAFREGTRIAAQATNLRNTETQVAIQQTAQSISQTETQIALVSPTPTASNTSSAPTLPPTITPTPLPSETPTFAPVVDLPGQILAWGGVDLSNRDTYPLLIYPISANSQPETINTDDGRYPVFSSDGSMIAYSRYIVREVDFQVTLIDRAGAVVPGLPSTNSSFILSDMPSFSQDASRLVVLGESVTTNKDEVYLVFLNGETLDGQSVVPLTNDSATYSFPSVSPDGSQVVAVRTVEGTTDLVLIDVNTRVQTLLTNDGNTVVETTPRWNPSGGLIAYAGYSSNRSNNDLYVIAPGNPGSEFRIVDHPGDDKYPVFNPDGRFMAFASNRGGSYDIFIYNLASQDLFQMTNTQREDIYPGSWIDG